MLQELAAEAGCARLLASLDFDRPELLAARPFRRRIDMENELARGGLEVRTTVSAAADDAVLIGFAFTPNLQIPGSPQAEWEVSFPVHRHLVLDKHLIPIGETGPAGPSTGLIGDRT